MRRFRTTTFLFWLSVAGSFLQPATVKASDVANASLVDSAATRKIIVEMINKVINASGTFDINAVANFYTPNALVADEEPPFSWNGPTAGAQWISAVEKTCKDLKIKRLKGKMGHINVYMQDDESVYVIVPAVYSGELKDQSFEEGGAFTFVFRKVNDKWLIKTQVWMSGKGM